MGITEIISIVKDSVVFAQKAGNIDQMKKLLDAQQEILNMQEETVNLKAEISKLKENQKIKEKIIRNKNSTFIKLEGDESDSIYCSRCYDKENILMQVRVSDNVRFNCPECNNSGNLNDIKEENDTNVYQDFIQYGNRF